MPRAENGGLGGGLRLRSGLCASASAAGLSLVPALPCSEVLRGAVRIISSVVAAVETPDPDLLFSSHDICEQNFHVIHCLLKIKSVYSFLIAEMRKQREFYHKLGMEVPGDIKGETCSAKQHLDPHRNGEWALW